jgi:hypothetical protein
VSQCIFEENSLRTKSGVACLQQAVLWNENVFAYLEMGKKRD